MGRTLFLFISLIYTICNVESVFLPYEIIQPAKNHLRMWMSWYSTTYYFPRQLGDFCDVSEEATLQYTYYESLDPRGNLDDEHPDSDDESYYERVIHVAKHWKFNKSKVI